MERSNMFRHVLSKRFWDIMENGIRHSLWDDGGILLVKYEEGLRFYSVELGKIV